MIASHKDLQTCQNNPLDSLLDPEEVEEINIRLNKETWTPNLYKDTCVSEVVPCQGLWTGGEKVFSHHFFLNSCSSSFFVRSKYLEKTSLKAKKLFADLGALEFVELLFPNMKYGCLFTLLLISLFFIRLSATRQNIPQA